MVRRRARELAMQILFQVDVGHAKVEVAFRESAARESTPEAALDYARYLVWGVLENQTEIDAQIVQRSREWTIDRLANVDRAILRIGLFELLFTPDVPASVAINEAVELAKEYSTAESGRFVNGVLGNLVREERPEPLPVLKGSPAGAMEPSHEL